MSSKPSKRPLKVRIKSGGGRSPASKRWLERQLNDPYVARAKREGFPSRAAFKLIEIDHKHHLIAFLFHFLKQVIQRLGFWNKERGLGQ